MKYILKQVNNRYLDSNNTQQTGNEGVFIYKFLQALKDIFGDRISFTENANFFNNGTGNTSFTNVYGSFPSNTDVVNDTNSCRTAIAGYKCVLVIDGIFTIEIDCSRSSYSSFTYGYKFLTPSIPLNNSSTRSLPFVYDSKTYTSDNYLRKYYIEVIEEQNFLILGIKSYKAETTNTIVCFKSGDSALLCNPAMGSNGSTYIPSLKEPSKYIKNSNTYTVLLNDGHTYDTSYDSNLMRFYNKYPYNLNDNNQYKIQMSPNKILLVNGWTEGQTNSVFKTLPNVYDCSYVPENMFYTINGDQYWALNNFTLLKIHDGVQVVDTLVESNNT